MKNELRKIGMDERLKIVTYELESLFLYLKRTEMIKCFFFS